MEEKVEGDVAKLFRSLEETEIVEFDLKVDGKLPEWLFGTLVRTGPGKFEIGEYKYNHWFDGHAMLHQFAFGGGRASYRSTMLQTDSYRKATKAGRNVLSEFATFASPDPCQSLFWRFFSYFSTDHNATDNCNVNILPLPSKEDPAVLVALTETPYSIAVETNTLQTLRGAELGHNVPHQTQTAHFHVDEEGNMWNVSVYFGRRSYYSVTKMKPTREDVMPEGKKASHFLSRKNDPEKLRIPAKEVAKVYTDSPSYMHSFAATKNYVIIVEWPLKASIMSFALASITGRSFIENWFWSAEEKTVFTVVSKEDGKIKGIYRAEACFSFHHVNAFENENGEIVIDVSTYENSDFIDSMRLEKLRDPDHSFEPSQLRRYCLPVEQEPFPPYQRLLDYEVLFDQSFELPRINEKYNASPYQYAYGISSSREGSYWDRIVKVDVENRESLDWSRKGCYTSEPIFVPRPNEGEKEQAEDDGVILSLVCDVPNERTFMLVIDAATFFPLAEVESPSYVPAPLHGVFLNRPIVYTDLWRMKSVARDDLLSADVVSCKGRKKKQKKSCLGRRKEEHHLGGQPPIVFESLKILRRLSIATSAPPRLMMTSSADGSGPDEEFRCGYLKKRTTGVSVAGNRWRDRYFVFTASFQLYWFKDQKDYTTIKKKGKAKKDTLTIDQNTVIRDDKLVPPCTDAPTPFCFQVVEKDGRVISLCASEEKDAQEWIELLQEAILSPHEYTPAKYRIVKSLKNNQFRIPPGDLQLQEEGGEIGSGASGVVKKGVWLKTTDVAVKILKDLPEFLDASESIAFYREMETLSPLISRSKLRHGSIVQMYGYCKKDNFVCLVTEYVLGGNLMALLHQNSTGLLDDWYQIDLALNICRGMVYLHSQDVIHRDLKPANILIESPEEGKLKVCDFGLSTVVKKGTVSHEHSLGSPQYAAPELGQEKHSNKVDVFSFAIILWEIAHRAIPWPELKLGSEMAEKYQKGERPEIVSGKMWKRIIEECWDHNPENRPTFKEVFTKIEALKQTHKRPTPHKLPSNINLSEAPTRNEKPDRVAKMIEQLFNNRPSISWQEFSQGLGNALGLIPGDIKQMYNVFATDGYVTKQIWDTFLQWFSPIKLPSSYETDSDENEDGYDVATVFGICTAPYFHAFLGSAEAQNLLKDKTSGTFLIRFSTTNPKQYALSATYGPNVGHWRITCERTTGSRPVFRVDTREYESLDELVKVHSRDGETLKTKTGESCFLIYPLAKPSKEE
ncbi:hypothetical protein PROFUN_06675 [Planoprotostelium fungivorum]|uniref:Uncharacterized protein n=1 Tax=Planoprotostelium fungivorum TaxID=1890364 RepID=A0A2P6NG14_9EUKA|nr:hypothetical protein PROFUN_06675 [Planoprotostelium fungivorum]